MDPFAKFVIDTKILKESSLAKVCSISRNF